MKLRRRKKTTQGSSVNQASMAPQSVPAPVKRLTPRIGAILRAKLSSEDAIKELCSQLQVDLSSRDGGARAHIESSGQLYIRGNFSGGVFLGVDEAFRLRAWLNEIFADETT